MPQLSFEIHRAVDGFETLLRAVCLIPGAGEFVYATEAVARKVGAATNVAENVHTLQGGTDWDVAVDQLAGDAAQLRLRLARGQLVRQRSAGRELPDPPRRRRAPTRSPRR